MEEPTEFKVDYKSFNLGTTILKFNLPMEIVDAINTAYDENSEDFKPHNDQLAGKIADEKLVDDIITPSMKNVFLKCFVEYINVTQRQQLNGKEWDCVLVQAWINDMKSNEYNPIHYHASSVSVLGLSSVLMLKRPDSYGVEASREQEPANGYLEFTGGDQSFLSSSQVRVDAQVGEFYIFPYTLLHTVYPFNSTDEVRRTMSYNCDLIQKGK